MITNEALWRGIDALAKRAKTSRAALAKKAGLDQTVFNPSKRKLGGKDRWISSETLVKALNTLGVSLSEYAALCEQQPHSHLELSALSKTGETKRTFMPGFNENTFIYRCGRTEKLNGYPEGASFIIDGSWSVRIGDPVFVQTKSGSVAVGHLENENPLTVEITGCKAIPKEAIDRGGRIVWVSA